jgi:hypothetical protein
MNMTLYDERIVGAHSYRVDVYFWAFTFTIMLKPKNEIHDEINHRLDQEWRRPKTLINTEFGK